MSAELQIRSTVLATLVASTVRRQLRTTCLPPFDGFSVDHLEVVLGAEHVVSGQTVEVHIPTDVFVVDDKALLAAPNATPAGAVTPAARILLIIGLRTRLSTVTGSDGKPATRYLLELVPQPPDLGPLDGVPGIDANAVREQIRASLPTSSIDLSGALRTLGITSKTADVVVSGGNSGDVVAVRIGPTGAPADRLSASQQWGMFLDAASVEALVRARVDPPVQARFPGAEVSVAFRPSGDVAHVDLSVSIGFSIEGFHLRGVIDLPLDFSIVPGPAPVLRETVDWSLHVFADLVPGFLEKIAEDVLEDFVDPSQFGGTATGDHTFVMDLALPPMSLPGAALRYDSVVASPAGMTIGGAVTVAGLYAPALAITRSRFGGPTRIQRCSQRARVGSGAPSTEPPTLQNTTSYGQFEITGGGAVCAVEVRRPDAWFGQFVSPPSLGTPTEDATVAVTIPYTVANAMTEPMTVVVRTPRGVRFVDLGMPPKAVIDATGRITDAHDFYIPDCLVVVTDGSGRAGAGWGGDVGVFVPPPMEQPDWAAYLQQSGGVVVQLVELTDLEPAELVRFRSTTHAIDVVADATGRAAVPVLLPMATAPGPALLQRAGGRPLRGHVTVRSVGFEHRLTLPGRPLDRPSATRSGGAFLATRSAGRELLHTLTTDGALSRSASGEAELNPQPLPPVESGEAELNPQPLPPVESGEAELNPQPLPPVEIQRLREIAARRLVRGLAQVVPIPGFAEHPMAIAVLRDGSALLLDGTAGADEQARIAGTFSGPIGRLDAAGDWAVSARGDATAVFRRTGR